METSPRGRTDEVGSDIFIILVTVANLVFITFYHKYIAWYTRAADGSISRISVLTDDYFTWLPFPITASILVIVATIAMMILGRYWFRQAAWIGFCLIGIVVTVSLLIIFPFDFSVIPNATAVDAVPRWLTVFLILWAVMYGTVALVQFVRLRAHSRAQ